MVNAKAKTQKNLQDAPEKIKNAINAGTQQKKKQIEPEFNLLGIFKDNAQV